MWKRNREETGEKERKKKEKRKFGVSRFKVNLV
ncbi:hypothetical protein ES332_A11G371800v1 [Gossypium tomentosum]|uniref:Uncharacterized protein n=1 Tax=Gossypium tomentosum TaxID=34277 RepID=A0A5D2NNS5_GOSTO|nr:hypothetical protein ES332_A11G371800v1 [Gossypium tomentosum]